MLHQHCELALRYRGGGEVRGVDCGTRMVRGVGTRVVRGGGTRM